MIDFPDIYFTPEYGRLYECHEGGSLETFSYKTGQGEVYFQFIKRPLDGFEGYAQYSDIVTPYGYGGPIFVNTEEKEKPELAAAFGRAFREYCMDQKIVSAFVRFHPILNNAPDFRAVFDEIISNRKTIAIDLTKDLFTEEFHTKIRNSYRYAEKQGLEIIFDNKLETIGEFIRLYYSLMDQKKTLDYYYFPDSYFYRLRELGNTVELVNAVLDGKIVASVLYLKYGDFIHTHLSATTSEGYRTRAVELIKSSRAVRAKDEGYKWCHLGGGTSNDPDDSLLRFKKKFSKTPPFDFYVGKSVYDPAAYAALCALADDRKKLSDDTFFPLYRGYV